MSRRHSRFRSSLLLLALSAVLLHPGCKPAKIESAPDPAKAGQRHAGRLDWSAWQRWVQTPPQVALVRKIDADTQERIAIQTRLFQAVISGNTNATPPAISRTQLDELRETLLASSTRTGNSPVPHIERWDRYANAARRMQPSDIATTITALESFVRRDRHDLTPQLGGTGAIGWQARSDLQWIDENITPLIATLKAAQSPADPAEASPISPEQARRQWQDFEKNELPKIAKAIKARTVDTAALTATGAYELDGEGQIVAIVTVAGRELYFPADPAPDGLRFSGR